MKPTKKQIWVYAGALLLILGIFIDRFIYPFPRAFDSQLWTTCKDHSTRLSMVDDLQKKYKLIGMTRQQIFQLLGEPSNPKDRTGAIWDMGRTSGLDDCTFSVDFDKNERVVSVADEER